MRRIRNKSVQSISQSRIPKSVILINLNNMSQLESPSNLISLMTQAQLLNLNQDPFDLIKDIDSINYNYYF